MAKITKVMNMVALSKMKKAQHAASSGIPYSDMLNCILNHVTLNAGAYKHPLMEKRSTKRKLVILVSSDKGLCGSLNTNLFRECAKYDTDATMFIAVGVKASQFLQKTRRNMVVDFSYSDPPKLSEARMVCRFAANLFLDDEIDSADILFSYFVSTFKQIPFTWKFIPVGQLQEAPEQMPESVKHARMCLTPDPLKTSKFLGEYEFEPDTHTVYESLLFHSLDYQLLQIMREVRASVHSSRMVAMKQATDNANEMIGKLELTHNNLRQASITRDIIEVSSSAMGQG